MYLATPICPISCPNAKRQTRSLCAKAGRCAASSPVRAVQAAVAAAASAALPSLSFPTQRAIAASTWIFCRFCEIGV